MQRANRQMAWPGDQRGMTLIIAMLFLIILSLFAVSSFNSSTTNTKVTGNMIARQEAQAAAQWLIDSTISSAAFANDPKTVTETDYAVDLDGDGTDDLFPELDPVPTCQRSRAIKDTELDIAGDPDDLACAKGSSGGGGLLDTGAHDPTSGDSLCSNTEWNVRAVVNDPVTGARVAVNQGVGVRVQKTKANDYCT
jgi:type II secretory pathway pseudopilin PulG